MSARPTVYAIRVDPIACDGHGLCAELFPERIRLDDWGYPIIDPAPIGGSLVGHARRAVAQCPKLALHLEEARVPRLEEARVPRLGKGRTRG